MPQVMGYQEITLKQFTIMQAASQFKYVQMSNPVKGENLHSPLTGDKINPDLMGLSCIFSIDFLDDYA